MAGFTPMMVQYMEIKKQYEDCILFFRLGDFYEMFFSDAEVASRELELTLTGRDCGMEERAPMCGVPYHAADAYLSKLINKGYKVAICEQIEDPAQATGIVKRDVIRVITPGTVTDNSMLDDKKNNYLMCLYNYKIYFGLAAVDLSTGEFYTTRISWGNTINKVMDEIAKFSPSELVVNSDFYNDTRTIKLLREKFDLYITPFENDYYNEQNARELILDQFGEIDLLKREMDISINASGALLEYLKQTQKINMQHIKKIIDYKIDEYMVLDVSTRRNLEITETMRTRSKKGSLLWVLDRTMTSMGARMLRKWIEQPLIKTHDINSRLQAVNDIKEKFMVRMEIRELLKRVYDIERLVSRIVFGNVNCRDLVSLKCSLRQMPSIKECLKNCSTDMLTQLNSIIDPMEDISELIDKSIIDEPPIAVKEGGIIKIGYNEEVDKLREATINGKQWVADLESSEREKTGIKNLKAGFNRVFGYYLEVTKSYYNLVPENYIRKQTLTNSERYVTEELKEMESKILGAEEKVVELEYKLFTQIRSTIAENVIRIKETAEAVAQVDVICSLAEVADRESYCMPDVNDDDIICIKDGRHPVVEKTMESGDFVPNDTILDMDENRLAVITGPNMAGKSTYMRQIALIVLMAQIGSFVPAQSAQVGIVDKIFTRVGASDDLASGQSTFMVEMSEVANILKNATNRSLLILDEVGRGTSTFDGLSIAWSVIEYVSSKEKVGSRTLFATHYHELTELEGKITGIKNFCISVEEKGEDITFLRKIIRGGADGSYGIHVAKLAGVPETVIDRARELLLELEESNINRKQYRNKKTRMPLEGQLDLISYKSISKSHDEVINDVKNLDISKLTPLDALNVLYKLQQKLRKE